LPDIFNLPAQDGARWFCDFGAGFDFADLIARLAALPGAEVIEMLSGHDGSWVGFAWQGFRFSANDPFGEVWLYAEDPATPDHVLLALVSALET
jgi:hypothetical protein